MVITPLELLDTSIAQLQTLVAFLDEQLDGTEFTTPETCACKEIARSLCILIRAWQAKRLQGSVRGQPALQKLLATDWATRTSHGEKTRL